MAGCGGLIRNEKGEWLTGYMAKVGTGTVIFSELWALFYGLKLAWKSGWRKVELESDAKVIINQFKSGQVKSQPLHPICDSIRDLINQE
ncbi:putative ribonuclease H-like domain-containing protein [Senna tora]|uniref:Putative ribonuclease H-like domain-containing protein n=1 Tax=Senna tora TaxID=362788 RepID=A0A834T1R7_9FABA|nr:putative ribonuclease H-like domain-containing protein [Senna tora]